MARQPGSHRDWDDAHLVNAALAVHTDDPVFGYRFITDELAACHGITASENRVHHLCRQHRISSVIARRRGKGLKGGPPVHEDLVRRDFTAEAPNRLWLTDIERHEAFLNRAVVKGHRHVLVAASASKLRAA